MDHHRRPRRIFNSIIRAQLSTNEVDDVIEAAIMRGKSRNVPIGWWTGPATRPTDLGVSVLRHGFIHEWDMPGMAINLSALNANMPIPLGLGIEQVTDIESLKKWHHALVDVAIIRNIQFTKRPSSYASRSLIPPGPQRVTTYALLALDKIFMERQWRLTGGEHH